MNSRATGKFHIARYGREEAIAKSWLDEQKSDKKARQGDKLTRSNEVQKGSRNLDV